MGRTAAEAAQGPPMKCGLNAFGYLCIHRARPTDPLCTDHALLARGRAGLPAGGGKPIDLGGVHRRLESAGCDVPEQQADGIVAVLRPRRAMRS
jgi:hypothetical protein